MMPPVVSALLAFVGSLFRSRISLYLEHLALRHQLAVYQHTVYRPRLHPMDRLFWGWLSRLWHGLSATGPQYGDQGSPDRPPESVAEPLRGAAHREYPPGMPGPRDRPAQATSEAAPDRLLPVLSSLAYAQGAGYGLSCAAAGPMAGGWLEQGSPRSGWVTSPL